MAFTEVASARVTEVENLFGANYGEVRSHDLPQKVWEQKARPEVFY